MNKRIRFSQNNSGGGNKSNNVGGGSSGGSTQGSSSSSSSSSSNSGSEESGELNLDSFEYPDSPATQKWLADNADLSPLTVLDNISLKAEFPYAAPQSDVDKPPDQQHQMQHHQQHHIHLPQHPVPPATSSSTVTATTTLDASGNLLQFSASVPPPVPDSTATFLDIGADNFSQSLYDDLGDINLADFNPAAAAATAAGIGVLPQAVSQTVTSIPQQQQHQVSQPVISSDVSNISLIAAAAAAAAANGVPQQQQQQQQQLQQQQTATTIVLPKTSSGMVNG